MKSVYYLYYDLETNVSQMLLPSGEIKEYSGTRFLDDINNKKRKQSIVFVNNITIVKQLIDGVDGTRDEIFLWQHGFIQFRSMNGLTNLPRFDKLCELYDTTCIPQAFRLFVENLGDPQTVKYGLATNTKRMFYSDLDLSSTAISDIKRFRQCIAGDKAGAMPIIESIREIRPHVFGADSYDMRSAYASVLCTDDMYPLGKVHASHQKDILNIVEHKKWCKIVFDVEIEGLCGFYDEEYGMTALEYYDILYLRDFCHDDISNYLHIPHTVLWSDETGYLDKRFRDKMHETYVLKQSLDNNDPRRFFVKMQLEMVYGKSIQKRDFKSDMAVKKFLETQFLQPHQGMHTTAAVRYNLVKAMLEIPEHVFYWDTDCLKVDNEFDHKSYFNELNQKIIEKNRKAGYDSDIGTFKHEGHYDEFKVWSLKVYAYRQGNDFTLKAAGFADDLKEEFLSMIGDVSIIDFIDKRGLIYYQKGYIIEDGIVKVVYIKKNPLDD